MNEKLQILFLDDAMYRHKSFFHNNYDVSRTHVYDADSCLEKLRDEDNLFDIVFLDHDLDESTNNELNDDEKDGRHVTRMMTSEDILSRYKEKVIVIHSLNSQGARIMYDTLTESGYTRVNIQPFVWEMHVKSEYNNWL